MGKAYAELGQAIANAMKENGFSLLFLAKHLAFYMNLTPGGAEGYIHYAKKGEVYLTIGTPSNPERKLEWLAIISYALDLGKKHPEVIEGIKKIDGRFKYPPENGISYKEIKAVQEAKKNDERASLANAVAHSRENRVEGTIDDRVKKLLALPVSYEPDSAFGNDDLIKREIIVEGYNPGLCHPSLFRLGIEIKIMPINGTDDYCRSFEVSNYPGASGRKWREELENYIESSKGKEAHIVYNKTTKSGKRYQILQLIAPLSSTKDLVVCIREKGSLTPYRVNKPLLESLVKGGLVIQEGDNYRIKAPVLSRA